MNYLTCFNPNFQQIFFKSVAKIQKIDRRTDPNKGVQSGQN